MENGKRSGSADRPGGPVPPGPRGYPLLGSLPHVGRDRLGLMVSAVQEYGDAVRLRMGPKTLYLFNHPDHAKHVLSENFANYHKGLGLAHARRALGDGLLTSEGDLWRRQRRAVQPAFTRERVAAAATVIADEADRMLARWRAAPATTINLVTEMTQLTLGVLGKSLLNADLSAAGDIGPAFEAVQDQAMFEMVTLNAVPPWLPLPRQLRFRRARRELDHLVSTLVTEHGSRADHTADDLLSRLIDSLPPQSGAQGRRQLRDELVTLLLAGHETTASTLGWTWYLVSQHPEVSSRLHAEALEVLGDRLPTYADLARLTYTTQVVEEAIRLYPPVWMLSRRAVAADEIGGYPIPAGADVLICPYTVHRNPRFWHAPETFDPERFRPDIATARPRYAYIPFGAGPRFCVGSNLGLLEAVLVVAMMAREFRLTLASTRPVVPEPMLSLRLRGGLPVTVAPI
jgi:enediyne biosynthesis protein E7